MEKKVLVLGLEASGKSTLVSQIVKEAGQKTIALGAVYKPTEGFNVTSLSDGTSPTVNIWESMNIFYLPTTMSLYFETKYYNLKSPLPTYFINFFFEKETRYHLRVVKQCSFVLSTRFKINFVIEIILKFCY